MQWLIANIWMAMAAATVLGLLFGFAFRGILVGSRIRKAEVEREVAKTELSQTKAEVEALYAAQRKQREEIAGTVNNDDALRAEIEERDRHIVSLRDELSESNAQIEALKTAASEHPNGLVAAGAATLGAVAGSVLSEDHEAELTQLRDRNAWLEERVGALEADISAMQVAPMAATEPDEEVDSILAEKTDWKASYLALRVDALEQELITQAQAMPQLITSAPEEQPVAADVEATVPSATDVDEELANLRWRNRYLEGRLAYFEEAPEENVEDVVAEVEPESAEGAELRETVVEADTEEPAPEDTVEELEATPLELEASDESTTEESAEELIETPADPADESEPDPAEDAGEAIVADAEPAPEPELHPSDAILAQLDGVQPVQLDPPKDGGDDLTKITGIGPRIAEVLNGLGIWTFAQIAEWKPENETWVENHLSFKGRVSRENWVGQAKDLLVEA